MKTKLSCAVSIVLAASLRVSAADYETAQQLRDGDLLSADVLNDILERIELSLKPITAAELVGDWRITQFFCNAGATNCAGGTPDNTTFTWDPAFAIPITDMNYIDAQSNFSYGVREFDLTITAGGQGAFRIDSPLSILYGPDASARANLAGENLRGAWSCSVLNGATAVCHKDSNQELMVRMDLNRSSPNQFKMAWYGQTARAFNVLILNKYVDTPTGPTRLTSANAANGNKLTWQDNSNDETAFVIKRKSSIDGTYAELATAGANVVTFTDTAVTQDATYWYRVGARNASGDRLYSNAERHKTNTVTSN